MTEHENNLLAEDVLGWCETHYGHETPSVDVVVEAVVSLLFGSRPYGRQSQEGPPRAVCTITSVQ